MKTITGMCNILGILVAWILSIALLLVLIISPIALSAMSLLNPEVITQMVTTLLQEAESTACAPVMNGVSMHASTSESEEPLNVGDLLDKVDVSGIDLASLVEEVMEKMLEGVKGAENITIDREAVDRIVNSNAAKEFLSAYTEDIANAILGSGEEDQLDADKLMEIAENNVDEIVEIVLSVLKDDTKSREQMKIEITAAVRENADAIVESIPKPEVIKKEIVEEIPELEDVLKVFGMKDAIELAVIGVIAVLSLLIFVCRIPGFRGFRWLATILFVAGIVSGLVGGSLLLNSTAFIGLLPADMEIVSGLMTPVLSAFSVNILIRAGIMLVFAIVFSAAYRNIKRGRRAHAAA